MKAVKVSLYLLLLLDVVLLLWKAPLHQALDSMGWIVLLAVFEYESSSLHEAYASHAEKYALITAQIVAWEIVFYALASYIVENAWLNLANAIVWLLVCAAISYDVYAEKSAHALPAGARRLLKIVLYLALVGLAVAWGVRGERLDLFDAVLWIVCFGVIEMNIFKARPVVKAS